MITLKELEDAGYKRFNNVFLHSRQEWLGADFMMQKRVENLNGTKYFINVEAYPPYPTQSPDTWNFEASVQFTDNDRSDDDPFRKPTINVTHLDSKRSTLEEIEDFYENMWHYLGEPYYDKGEND
jgi:hypothetical protein